MMIQPTSSDIAKAKEYLRKRVAAEVSMEHYLDRKLLAAAMKIVRLAYKSNIPPTLFSFSYNPFLSVEIDRIINELVDEIEEYNLRLAVNTDKEEDDILLPYINREINGATYADRIRNYAIRFKMELQDLIGAGVVLGLSLKGVEESVRKSFKTPYVSSIASHLPHKGQSAYHRLQVLTRHTIADAWMHADMEYHIRKGAIGFITYRGSSYPCDLCSDYAGVFHTFAEPYPPLHPSCKCYAVPVYK